MDYFTSNLPVEITEKIILFIKNADMLLNVINTRFSTKTHNELTREDNHLLKCLIKANYPYFIIQPTDNLLNILVSLLKSYPNRLNEENWKLALLIEEECMAYSCPVSYMIMRGEVASDCNDVDYRLVKKLLDTEYISCDTNPNIQTPKSKWIINILRNAKNACDSMNASWKNAFKVFVDTYFGKPISQYFKKPECICNAPNYAVHTDECHSHQYNKDNNLQKENTRLMISLYLQETMLTEKYNIYNIHNIYYN